MAQDRHKAKQTPLITQKDVQSALIVGASTGGVGFVFGATVGVLRSTSPILFGLGSGLQCFGLGTFYWASRSAVLSAWHHDKTLATPQDRLVASTIGGGFAGVVMALLTRGRRNVIPGGIMFSLFGAGGQGIYNVLDTYNTARVEASAEKPTITQWVAKQKWSPISVLTDDRYEEILREKILKLDVEIALLDERIQQLKQRADARGTIRET